MIGFHSVMDSPDSVSRVMPPTTTIAKTRAATHMSHVISAAGRDIAISKAGEAELRVLFIYGDMRRINANRKRRRLQKLLS